MRSKLAYAIRCAISLSSVTGVAAETSGIGDIVASGIGLTSTSTTLQNITSASTLSVALSGLNSSTIPGNKNSTTSWPAGETGSLTTIDGATCTLLTLWQTGCASSTVSYGTDCWDNWQNYWAASSSASGVGCSSYVQTFCNSLSLYQTTLTSYDLYTIPPDQRTVSSTATITSTTTILDGSFGQATSTTTFTTVEDKFTYYSPTATHIITVNRTITVTESTGTISTIPAITPPPCTLPSLVAQCQSQWDSYVSYTPSNATGSHTAPTCTNHLVPSCSSSWSSYYYVMAESKGTWWNDVASAFHDYNVWPSRDFGPACTQASVASDACNSIQGDLATAVALGNLTAWRTITSTPKTGLDSSYETVWPSNFTYGPSCTMGCSACRITGGSVKLLYWPPATTSDAPNATGPVTALYGSMTLTSPTVYVSFHEVHAADSCGPIGHTYSDTLVPLRASTDLSSLYGFNWYYPPNLYTAPFNYSDLVQTPVPDSIYNSQPRCASSSFSWAHFSHPANGSAFSCDRITSYEPILSIPIAVRDLDPAWNQCFGAIEGIYDPPTALQPAATIAGPSGAGDATKTTASPAGVAQPTTPTATVSSLPTAAAESLPGPSAPATASTNAATSPNAPAPASDTPSASTQNAGGILASLLGSSPSGPPSASENAATLPDATAPTPGSATRSTQNAGGILASILGNNPSASPTIANNGGVPSGLGSNPSNPGQSIADPSGTSIAVDPIATAGGQTIFEDPSDPGAVILGGQTLTYGDGVTVGGTVVSVLPGNSVAVGTNTLPLPAIVDPTSAAVVTLGQFAQTIAVTSGRAVIGSQTLSVNGPAATISGVQVSLGSSGIVVSGSTYPVSNVAGAINTGGASDLGGAVQIITTDGKTITISHDGSGLAILQDASSTTTVGVGSTTVFDGVTVTASSGGIKSGASDPASATQSVAPIGSSSAGSPASTSKSSAAAAATSANGIMLAWVTGACIILGIISNTA